MAKQTWKAGNMLYPLPAVMVSVTDGEGKDNIITVAWAGTVCTNPPMVTISVRPSRYSYDMICKTGEFVLNLTTEELAYATDFCGVKSGREVDKFQELHLTKEKSDHVKAPMIGECPVNIECRVKKLKNLVLIICSLRRFLQFMQMRTIWIRKTNSSSMHHILSFIHMGNILALGRRSGPLVTV